MCNSSIASRIMYAFLLLLTTVVCCIMLAPGLQDNLASVPFCKSHRGALDDAAESLNAVGQEFGVGNIGQTVGLGTPTSLQVQKQFTGLVQSRL